MFNFNCSILGCIEQFWGDLLLEPRTVPDLSTITLMFCLSDHINIFILHLGDGITVKHFLVCYFDHVDKTTQNEPGGKYIFITNLYWYILFVLHWLFIQY